MTPLSERLPFLAVFLLGLVTVACGKHQALAPPDERVEITPERIARGQYLVDQVAACGACHTGREEDSMVSGQRTDRYLAGGNYIKEGPFTVWFPNITPDRETGIGDWTDGELIRAIREGVGRHGELLLPMMPAASYQYMSDEDVASIVAYLRSVPPVRLDRERERNRMPPPVRWILNGGKFHPEPSRRVPPVDRTDRVAYGQYLVRMGHCDMCHGMGQAGMAHPNAGEPMYMAGSKMAFESEHGKVWASNLTPDDETGIGRYSDEDIKHALRSGRRLDGRRMMPPMSLIIPHIGGMEEEDLDALVAYLRSLPPTSFAVRERRIHAEWVAHYDQVEDAYAHRGE